MMNAFAAEVYAMSHEVALGADLGVLRVQFETDSLLVEVLDLRKVDSSPYAAVIEDTKFQLKVWFSKHVVSVCRRSANTVAHELAKFGRLYHPNHCVE